MLKPLSLSCIAAAQWAVFCAAALGSAVSVLVLSISLRIFGTDPPLFFSLCFCFL